MKEETKEKDLIHIRKRWNAPGNEPAWCGNVGGGVGTVTDAWGYWGPQGDGWELICKKCVRAKNGGEHEPK